jgi:hypothetical protein
VGLKQAIRTVIRATKSTKRAQKELSKEVLRAFYRSN